MRALFGDPLFAPFLTLAVWALAEALYRRAKRAWLHPVLVTVAALLVLLPVLHIPWDAYGKGTEPIAWLLGPSVVALAVPLRAEKARLVARSRPILVALTAGAIAGVASAVLIARALGAPRAVVMSLAPKSVTTPIAMEITTRLGGIPGLTAVVVILVGILGAAAGPGLGRLLGLRDRAAWGLAMGAAGHALGTSRAIQDDEEAGAASALALAVHGVLTAIVAGPVVALIDRFFGR
jgi:predicted murein hydrolase (TIGR00659 family)